MNEILAVLNVLLPVVYTGAWAAYLCLFLKNTEHCKAWSRRGLDATILIHLAMIVLRAIDQGRVPMATPLEFLSLLAFATLLIYAVIEHRTGVRQTGVLIVGLAALMQIIASAVMPGARSSDPLLQDPGYTAHAGLVLLAYASLSLSFLYAVLYLVQMRQLSRKQFGLWFRRLPPLETLERMSVGAVRLGVPLLFAALAMGHLWLYHLADRVDPDMAAKLTPYDPKILVSWVIFLGYSLGLIGHRWWGWRGRRMTVLAITAYLIVIATMGAIHRFIPSFHDFTQGGGA